MLIRRAHAAVALAVAAGLALSGCSIFTDGERVWTMFQEEEAAKGALNDAVTALRALDGVVEASSVFDRSGPGSLEAEIAVTVEPDATVAQLRAVAGTASEALEGEVLSKRSRTFTLEMGDASVTQLKFGIEAETVADEIEYWASARRALGVPLMLTLDGTGDEYWRMFQASEGAAINKVLVGYEHLLAVADPSSVGAGWILPGISASGLPPIEVVKLLNDLSGVVPIEDTAYMVKGWMEGDEKSSGVQISWQPDWQSGQQLFAVYLREGDDVTISWTDVVAVAELALQARATSFVFSVGSPMDANAVAEFSSSGCPWQLNASEKDVALSAALISKGVLIPDDVEFGSCEYVESPAP